MKVKIITLVGIVVVAIVTIVMMSGPQDQQANVKETEDIKQLVHDYSIGNITDQSASITSEQLVVTNEDESQEAYDLPEDEFFVSIAPYEETTHPCAVHSLTGCQGELANETFHVTIVDDEGDTVMDQEVESLANGFIDLWLERDKNYQVTIAHDDKVTESEITTFENDNTCITTMQLEDAQSA
ncbi:CueP family metal-binding protein [Aquibacillus sediminis]|uniref:CueP family metal-binding protein n=1 Tax=Aquibacillus sediminis TaxID=2574734 RepID=UPI00110979A8|nr:CueP family metal-binding protein [Aquibacillus sediminis]